MLIKSFMMFVVSLILGQTALAYNVGTSYPDTRSTYIVEGYYDVEYQCKKVPEYRKYCGFERQCARGGWNECRDIPYCVTEGRWVERCGNEDVFKTRGLPGQ